jgi:hypothetical protein
MGYSLFPGFVKIDYVSNGHPHVMTVPVIPVLDTGVWKLTRRDATLQAWGAAITAFAAYIQPFLAAADIIVGATLYTLASPTATPIFQDSVSLALHGSSGGADVPWTEWVFTARASNGGLLKIYVMEGHYPPDEKSSFPSGNADADGIAAYVLLPASVIVARNGQKVLLPLRYVTKINDMLRKKYFNP